MIMEPLDNVRQRAETLAAKIVGSAVQQNETAVGGGSTPDQTLPSYVVEIQTEHAASLERKLRANNPSVLVRIEKGKVLLDCRTLTDSELPLVAQAVNSSATY
jgi:L-seryl-tRNA(Ser) seleniumtransferase